MMTKFGSDKSADYNRYDLRRHTEGDILSSHENPKICGIDDAEVVGDLVAV